MKIIKLCVKIFQDKKFQDKKEVYMVLEIINIIAIIVIPIFAVLIGQWLQNRSEKRKDKVRVFSHLMSYRAIGYVDQQSVNILNLIPIVFNDDKNVIEKYNIYLKSLNIKTEDFPQKQKEIENNKTKMLEEMAKNLGYKNINWEIIQNPYLPQGLINEINSMNLFKQGQLEVVEKIKQQMGQPQMRKENKTKKM